MNTQELKDFLQKTYNGSVSNEERYEISQSLIALYSYPETIESLFEILKDEPNQTIRLSSCIAIAKSIKIQWESQLRGTQFGEWIKQTILKIFENNPNDPVSKSLVHSMNPILTTDGDQWSDLFTFMYGLGAANSLSLLLYLSQHLVGKLNSNVLSSNLEFFSSMLSKGFCNTNDDIIIDSCGLLAVLLNNVQENEVNSFSGMFEDMLSVFEASLKRSVQYSTQISSRICFSFNSANIPLPPVSVLNHLLSLVKQPWVSHEHYVVVFTVIGDLVSVFGEQFKANTSEILSSCIYAAAAAYQGGNFDDEEDSFFIVGTIEAASKSIKGRRFFSALSECFLTEDISGLVASSLALYRCIDTLSEQIMQNIVKITEFVMNNLQNDHSCVQEIALMTIEELGKILQEGQSDLGNQFINSVFPFFESEDVVILGRTLCALSSILSTSDIEKSSIPILLEKVVYFADIGFNRSQVFEVLSNLVFSSGMNIVPYAEQIFNYVFEAASIDESIDPKLKQNAIEALGNLLRFSGETLVPVMNDCINLLLQSSESDDFDMRDSVIIALQNLIIVKNESLNSFSNEIYNIIDIALSHYINSENDNQNDTGDEEEDSDENDIQQRLTRYINDSLLMTKNVFKYMVHLLPDETSTWKEICLKITKSSDEDLQSSSILALTYMAINLFNHGGDISDILQRITKTLKSDKPLSVAMSFKALVRFAENNISLDKEVLEFAIGCSVDELDKEEKGENEVSESELRLSVNLYRFLAMIATMFCDIFPINRYIDHGKSVMHEGSSFLHSQYLGVLRQLYMNSGSSFRSYTRNFIIKSFVEGIEICDFSVIPESIIALRHVLEHEPQLIQSDLEDIMMKIDEIINSDYNGELHYWTTISDSISFLCSFARLYPSEFDYNLYVPLILNKMPVKGDEMEAENIYSELVKMASSETVVEFQSEFANAFIQTMCLPPDQLDAYHLSSSTFEQLKNISKHFISQMGGIDNVLTFISDESLVQNLINRIK